MTDAENRLRAALNAEATVVVTDSSAIPPFPTAPSVVDLDAAREVRRPWLAPLLAAAAVVAMVAGASVVLSTSRAGDRTPPVGTSPTGPVVSSTPATTPTNSTPAPTGSTPTSSNSGSQTAQNPPPPPPPTLGGNQPLWPFASFEQAEQWRAAYREQGSQPWHLSAQDTALNFTRGFLGFNEIDRVTSTDLTDNEAHIGVGYVSENGLPFTAAILHLYRYGSSPDSGWEVVGSDDTDFSIEQPSYGSTVKSPMTVGGHISGVDESIRVTIRQSGIETPLGSAPGVPAGGQNEPWSTRVSFTGGRPGAMVIVAQTGGHLQEVERFSIHGVVVS